MPQSIKFTVTILLIAFVMLAATISLIAQPVSSGRNISQTGNDTYNVGRNRFITIVDGDKREYFVHVPQNYNPSEKIPVVFMLHGTSGNGAKFYAISGWKELGERENILTVFPSSWQHCIVELGVRKTTTKWNIFPGSFQYCEGEQPKDDINFLNQVIDELNRKFKVDSQRIYFVGFSNGGQMTARVGVEMSDRVAAVVSASGISFGETVRQPKRLLPNLIQVGANDRIFVPLAFGRNPAPMNFEQLSTVSPFLNNVLEYYRRTYQLNPTYQTAGDRTSMIWLDDYGTSGNKENVLRFVLINGMDHIYPNGVNFRLSGPQMNWDWMKQFQLPEPR